MTEVSLDTTSRNQVRTGAAIVFGGALMTLVLAWLVAADLWYVAVAALLAVPAIVLAHRSPLTIVAVWFLLLPFVVEAGSSGMLRRAFWLIHRAAPLGTVLVVVAASALGIRKRSLGRLGRPEVLMTTYLAITVASIMLFNTTQLATLVVFYDRVISPMALYLLIRLLRPGKTELLKLLPVVVVVVMVQTMVGGASWLAPALLPESWSGDLVGIRTAGTVGAVSVFGVTMISGFLLLLHGGLSAPARTTARRVYTWTAALSAFMVFMTMSRGSWLAGLLALGVASYLYPRAVAKATLILVPALLVAFTIGPLQSQFEQASIRLASEKSEQTALDRLPVAIAAIRMFEAKPIAGWGYGNFDNFDRQFQEPIDGFVFPEKDLASHNVYLTLLAEQGAPGLGFFLAPAVLLLIWSLRVAGSLPRSGFISRKLLIALWAMLAAHFAVNNFSNMRGVFGLSLWWLTLGMIAVIVSDSRKADDDDRGVGDEDDIAPAAGPAARSKNHGSAVRRLRHSDVFKTVNLQRHRLQTSLALRASGGRFNSVRTFCLFVGPVKSGGTLLGSLLDAHPQAVVSDELGVVWQTENGFRRDQLFQMIYRTSHSDAMRGRITARRLDAYSFAVPGQSQGVSGRPRLMGDSRAGPTTRLIGERPETLARFIKAMKPVEVCFVQVVRNPIEPIAAMVLRSGRPVSTVIDEFFDRTAVAAALVGRVGGAAIRRVRYEDVIADPIHELAGLCEFLGLEASPAYLEACAGVLDATPRGHSHLIEWPADALAAIARRSAEFDFLADYEVRT